jgi:hypothetical protein
MGHAEHVSCLMDHHMAGIEEELLLGVLTLVVVELGLGVIADKAENSRARLIHGPPKYVVPVWTRV